MAGQIIPRGDRTWMVRVFMGRDGSGKRQYHNHTVRGTKKDAQRYLNDVLAKRDSGTFVEPTALTVEGYLKRWLEEAARPRVRPRTFSDYEDLLARYVMPALGQRRLSQLQPLDIQSVYTGMLGRGLSARTVRYTHAVLSSALKQSVKWRLAAHNPAEFVDLPRQERTEMRALSPEEAGHFLRAAAGTKWAVLFEVALVSGMRPGELLALRWSDADLDAGTVTVRRSLSKRNGKWTFTEPKTSRSRRTIALPPSTVRSLADHKRHQAQERLAHGPGYQNEGLVFAGEDGQPLDEHNLVARHFKPLLKAAGLPDTMRLYDLRHSCATLLLSQGEHPKVVSERLGHASTTLTLDTYSHVLPTMQQRAADRLEQVLFTGS